MIENLDKIKAAIEIETKYRYIDIHGKTQKFSSFIIQLTTGSKNIVRC